MPTIQFKPLTENDIKGNITAKLRGLGITNFNIEEAQVGPIVTAYPIQLHPSTPLNKIMSKSEDLALAVGAEFVDIRRIGNRVVVFVPNKDRSVVNFMDALYWYLKDEEVRKMNLPLLLGMDFHGIKAAIDLSEQPHVLIAGSTGSGKSIFESNLIASLAMFKSERELELYLIDTKGMDLNQFRDLPHVREVANDVEDWYSIINHLFSEVHRRTKKISSVSARNINEYNAIMKESSPENVLTYIVVVIDELADLIAKDKVKRDIIAEQNVGLPRDMRLSPEPKVSESLARLIQICRAVGIHVIACTQRTSVDVVSGLIKANFPTRISLKLPTGIDSRTILDESGAENLLGKGDMLLKASNEDSIKRYHAPFVRLEDVDLVLNQREMILKSLGLEA